MWPKSSPRTGHVDRESESLRGVDVLLSVVDEERLFGLKTSLTQSLSKYLHLGLGQMHFVGKENMFEIIGGGTRLVRQQLLCGIFPVHLIGIAQQEYTVVLTKGE